MQSQNLVSSARKSIFTEIHSGNLWGGLESRSGTGSDAVSTGALVDFLPCLFKVLNVTRVLDAPCGDFHWMKYVVQRMRMEVPEFAYWGVDIVTDVLKTASVTAAEFNLSEHCKWLQVDLVEEVPRVEAELLFIRDLLGHLPLIDVQEILNHARLSGATWLLSTHFPEVTAHQEISTGQWQPMNLTAAPFYWPKPAFVFNEKSPEASSKSLGLWRLT